MQVKITKTIDCDSGSLLENQRHWVLDIAFHDDLARLRTGLSPKTMTAIEHLAMKRFF